jgi:hypothetical protein
MKKSDDDMWQSQYRHSDYMEDFLKDITRGKKVLNLFSGKSLFGDIRLDHDTSLQEPTAYVDVFKTLRDKRFKDNSIPFVYADGIYGAKENNIYNPRSKAIQTKGKSLGLEKPGSLAFLWQKWAYDIADVCLITRRDRTNVNLPSLFTEYYVVWDSRPSLQLLRFDWKRHPV